MTEKIKSLEDECEMIKDKFSQIEKDIINKEERYMKLINLVTNGREKTKIKNMRNLLSHIERRIKS